MATGLVAELRAKFGDEVVPELVEGDRGMFEVSLEGELIYSKLATRVFPRYGEIPELIDERR
jgi:selT/selW/selH-like putative selenoprotein